VCSHRAFYRVVGQRKADDQGEGGSSDGTSMVPVTGDENREGRRWGATVFRGGRGGGGEVTPWCRRRMI
jgi:hypothetical protein